ncbi:BppU family phage baseplate upper protein [Bacillus subtilis]|uniref:BppU family phage baseplate upper protein n=1 Tax=Bacillus subtilis TaxID=1423 RepID=UPI0021B1560B|nr:BppU family phage baseplate upper protein [Bacillus subtilis]MCT6511996.1 BppU family phage baseplate upper protein [Bacillus subtilis]WRU05102.1 BppU family phage baseplate upper protein [Bacillus subtilis]
MPYKDESLSFTINGRRKSPVQTNIQYTTQDKGTAKLSFQLMKDGVPLPLSSAVVKLVLLMSDGSRFVRNIEIIDKLNGRLTYVLSDEEIKHVGTVQAELDVSYTNQQAMSIHEFSFEIKKALIDTDILPSAEYYIDDFESLKNKINELYNETIQTVEELRKKFEDLENIETKDGAQKKADAVQTNLDTHINNKSNPHGVTKSQVGLGNVENVKQASKTEFDNHVDDTSNPHKVTADQVGLGNVDNVKQADYYEFRQHNFNNERHVTKNDKDKWNAGQLYKLTQDNGRVFYKASSETTDYNELTDTGMYLIYNAGLHGPGLTQCFLLIMSYGNTLVQTAYDATNGLKCFNRIRKNDWETWTPWIEVETVGGSQKKIDAHANKIDIHVTKSDKDKWNGAQLMKITSDVGSPLISISDSDDFYEKIIANGKTFGTFYSTGNAKNSPSSVSTRGTFHFTSLDDNGKGTYGYIIATDWNNNVFSNYLDKNRGWSGWKRLLTENDTDSVPWLNATYKNGAKTGDRQLQFKKVAGALHLTGHIVTDREVVFASIPSSYAPSKGVMELIAVSGITGISKLIVFPSGDLKLTGLMANDSSKVTGYYIDKVIPLN